MSDVFTEVIPSEYELQAYKQLGLKEVRSRRQGDVLISLAVSEEGEPPVVGFYRKGLGSPITFPVPSAEANGAFEHPLPHAPTETREALGGLLLAAA